ncbi:MAG: hypothetical protein EBZ49_03865 [Proteobacteria bacterium]|nr:hypothetical protein [Pseudomonadota bacterium]
MFVLVIFVEFNVPVLTDVVARIDAVVIPVVNAAVPLLKLVATTFVDVILVELIAPVLIDVDASIVPVVILFTFIVPELNEVVFTVPDDTFVNIAFDELNAVATIFDDVTFVLYTLVASTVVV